MTKQSIKLQAQRLSGEPVMPDALAAYKIDFQAGYDRIAAAAGLDMLELQKNLQALDIELSAKYSCKELMQLPQSRRAWLKLIKQFECPFMLAPSSADPNVLILVLCDRPIG